ncbi:MAG: enoyl-CoA hydratase/isomerase family protein [Acidimicrobiia bacterium]|nr:enoyl-CoA hydratase/isomerase family protein [Acidimicrobiia bacterium]
MNPQVHISHPVEGVAQLLMDNGPGNFGTAPLHERLLAALDDVRQAGVRVVVLGSAVEGVFISHGHIGDIVNNLTGGPLTGDPRSYLRLQKELDTGPMVTIAALDGQAWGGGFGVALSCDFRVASERTTIGQPEIVARVTTAGEASRISRIAGEAAAKRLILDGRPITATEAHRLGLIDRLVPDGTALQAAVQWASWLAQREPGDLATVKDAIIGGRDLPLGEALKRETAIFVSRFGIPDVVARLMAVQGRYDEGADSYDAFGIPRE